MASMIEFWDYLLQFVVSAIGCVMASVLYAKMRRQPYFLLACFFGTYSLGTLYWTLHVLLLGTPPQVFYVSELEWIASYVFLLTIELTLPSDEEKNFRTKLCWLCPVFCVPQFILYITHGDVFFNILMCLATAAAAWLAIRGLVFCRRKKKAEGGSSTRGMRFFHITVLCFVVLEYALWTSSCFWVSDTLSNPYFWFDFLLSGAIFAMLPATRKAVGK